jgi:hypothetical protein
MADANRVAQQAQREQVVPPPTMYTGTAPTTGEAGRGAYGVPGATMNYADVTGALGKPGENLEQIPTPGGGKVTVNKGAAEAFRGFMKDLAATGYHVGQVEGFNKREKRGGTGWSEHAYGAAIDINPAANPQGGTQTNMPANIHEMAAKWGLIWGGDWKGKTYDPMHFQWGGSKPWETAVAALQKPLPEHMKPAPVQVAANPMYPQADQAAPAAPHLVSGLAHLDRAFADTRLTNQSTTNNTGHTFNEGDRNVSMNPVTNITINGGEGGSPQDQSSRYSRASSRIYGDLLRNMKTNVA